MIWTYAATGTFGLAAVMLEKEEVGPRSLVGRRMYFLWRKQQDSYPSKLSYLAI